MDINSTHTSPLDGLAAHYLAMPPVAAMQPAIAHWQDGHLRLRAPLAANVNDKGCAFGGSLCSLMTLALGLPGVGATGHRSRHLCGR